MIIMDYYIENNIFFFFLQDIGMIYQIFADEVLGSGQFGVVYGGMFILNKNKEKFSKI